MAELTVLFERGLKLGVYNVKSFAGMTADQDFSDDITAYLSKGGQYLDVEGEDLTYDSGFRLASGTVTGIDHYLENSDLFYIDDASVSASAMMAASTAGNAAAFFGLFLAGDDSIYGGDGNDELMGFAGNDEIDGGLGTDLLLGGPGDDIYYISDVRATVREFAGEGNDLVYASVSFTTRADHVETVILEDGALNATTGLGDTHIYGNAANNRLDGGAGADILEGGAGDDTYIVDDPDDIVVEAADGGFDTIQASVSYALQGPISHVERLELIGSALDATGDNWANTLVGNNLANRLEGGGDADILIGGGGNDTYVVDSLDTVTELAKGGTDLALVAHDGYVLAAEVENLTLIGDGANNASGNALKNLMTGNDAANRLFGLAGDDTLLGGGGDDLLSGGEGKDRYTGGAGADTFVIGEDPAGAKKLKGIDTINDFSGADGDRLAIGEFLSGYDPLSDDLADFVFFKGNATKGKILIDADGLENGSKPRMAFATIIGAHDLIDGPAVKGVYRLDHLVSEDRLITLT